MGCSACVHEQKITNYNKNQNKSKVIKLRKLLGKLKPCKLIPSGEFHYLYKIVEKQLLEQSIERHKIQQIMQINMSQNMDKLLINQSQKNKWKLIILCSNIDFYQQKYNENQLITHHKCFSEIQLDLHRTFPDNTQFFKQNRALFKSILRKLAIYFPQVGYTQGINFIVGYLMIIGYQETQIFWLIIHLALNEEHLLLGLFQDKFPICHIYCRLFNILFKNLLPNSYQKFKRIGIQNQLWVFKWFMTYYLYSFPFEIVKHIWDFTITVGGLGLVYFAVALMIFIEKDLDELKQDIDIIIYFNKLRQYDEFTKRININDLIELAYTIDLSDDMISKQITQMINENQYANFYMQYYANYHNKQKREKLRNQWINSILKKKIQYEQIQRKYYRNSTQLQAILKQKFSSKKEEYTDKSDLNTILKSKGNNKKKKASKRAAIQDINQEQNQQKDVNIMSKVIQNKQNRQNKIQDMQQWNKKNQYEVQQVSISQQKISNYEKFIAS